MTTPQLSDSRLGFLQRLLKLLLKDKETIANPISSNISAIVRFQRPQSLIGKIESEIEAYGKVKT